ncbi:MAG TPA: HD domain-containing phosphohydrolase [Candidatus Acidoferrum sp.]|nr:HD domain-containing phosphohydrolase [Candidatus Acidoferrum sp.]
MKPTILLVDIASHDRENQRMFLQSHGYEVFVAETEETAQQLCRQVQPDLVLLHDSPPHLAGPELCRRLKQEPLNQLTPVVLVSSSATPADVLRGGEAGAASFWDTPCTLRDALGRIEAFLRLKNYIDEQAKAVVLTLALSVETRHSVADEHSGTLADYASRLGQNLGMTEEELEELRLGCLLHDIGNVAIPDRILLKPDRLNREETEIVRQHPATGERICAPLKSLRRILPLIRHHHERMNGSGYPDGLRGEEIPLPARILQIADVYDALMKDRPYRTALSSAVALEILRQEAARGWLDSDLVLKFSRICQSSGFLPVRGRSMLASYYT